MKELVIELVENKPEDENAEEIMSFAEDILRCIESEEEEEYEINQQFAGIKELF